MRRPVRRPPVPPPPTVPELARAPELAAVILLEHALDVVREAMLAEHPTLADDLRGPHDDGPVVATANAICLRVVSLRDILRRYRRAVRAAAETRDVDTTTDDDLIF